MRLTIIPSDNVIGIDGIFLSCDQEDIQWIPSNIHAIQWYDTWGEIEYNDETLNQKIEELGIFEKVIKMHQDKKNRIKLEKKQEEKELEENDDHWWGIFTKIRNGKLYESDWTQGNDSPLTEEQKNSWKEYRQQLRDLPTNITDPRPLVKNPEDSNWPLKPIY